LAFLSGLTALGYQVLWLRQLSSGTGAYTYVFAFILVLFLAGLAIGARILVTGRLRRFDAVSVITVAQLGVAIAAVLGLVLASAVSSVAWPMLAIVVVTPTAVLLGITFPASASLLPDRADEVGTETGQLLAVNTTGAIAGSFLVPFLVVPLIGTPGAVALLAGLNAAVALVLVAGVSAERTPPLRRPLGSLAAGATIVAAIVVASMPSPTVARILEVGGSPIRAVEDEIAETVVALDGERPRLWVNGISMTTLTVDTRLMSVLPMVLRPDHRSELIVAFGMGSTFRTALLGGIETEAIELVPSVPGMFDLFFPDAAVHLADPIGRILVADGRNHVELSDRQFSAVVVDPPPPIESAGVSVIASLEFYQASARLLEPGGVMVQWVPAGQTADEMRAHIRTFRAVFPHMLVLVGVSDTGIYLVGSAAPLSIEPAAVTRILTERPAVLDDISSAFDSPATTVSGWATTLPGLVWLVDEAVDAAVGAGPLITDDRPMPEYFLLRRLSTKDELATTASRLRELITP
jgi:spermidine synthase